jgi:hypothetical protein
LDFCLTILPQHDQKAGDLTGKFLFLCQAFKQNKAGGYTMQEELLCLGNNALYLKNNVLAPISSVTQEKLRPS